MSVHVCTWMSHFCRGGLKSWNWWTPSDRGTGNIFWPLNDQRWGGGGKSPWRASCLCTASCYRWLVTNCCHLDQCDISCTHLLYFICLALLTQKMEIHCDMVNLSIWRRKMVTWASFQWISLFPIPQHCLKDNTMEGDILPLFVWKSAFLFCSCFCPAIKLRFLSRLERSPGITM